MKPSILLTLFLAAVAALPAQVLTTIHTFCASGTNCVDGENVYAGLVQGSDGDLYGTTFSGGMHDGGTAFKVSPKGSFTTLHHFCALAACADGASLYAGLTLAHNGAFFGVTQGGGAAGYGTVFTMTPGGSLTTLYSFCFLSQCADGGYSYGGLFQAADGNFYGTTYVGGGAGSGQSGTIFSITSTGLLTTVYQFCPSGGGATECPDGADAMGGVVQGRDGSFYGTANNGGGNLGWTKGLGNFGTAFKVAPTGNLTVLHTFGTANGFADGVGPKAGLVQGSDGSFYGTTYLSGAYGSYGTIFKVTPGGAFTTLHSFCSLSGCSDGANPTAALIQASDGNFYGTTEFGGSYNSGTIFRISPQGAFTKIYNFCAQAGCPDGASPYAALLQATDGKLYGTTYQGGLGGKGTVFVLSLGLPPL